MMQLHRNSQLRRLASDPIPGEPRQEESLSRYLERHRSSSDAVCAGRAARARASGQAEHQRESVSAVAARLEAIRHELGDDGETLRKLSGPDRARTARDGGRASRHCASSRCSPAMARTKCSRHAFQALLKHDKPILFPRHHVQLLSDLRAAVRRRRIGPIPLDDAFGIDVDDYRAPNGGVLLPNPNAPTGPRAAARRDRSVAGGEPGLGGRDRRSVCGLSARNRRSR